MKIKKLVILIVVLLAGCSKDKIDEQPTSVLLLKIDYMTNVFEGGFEQTFSGTVINSDSILIKVDYQEPGDVGNLSLYYQSSNKLYYQPSNNLLFDGSIIWIGKGQIKYPKDFNAASTYSLIETSIDKPADSRFQLIFYELSSQPIDYTSLWNSISRLTIVSGYMASNKKLGLFLYRPSVGMGNPDDWDWFILMNK